MQLLSLLALATLARRCVASSFLPPLAPHDAALCEDSTAQLAVQVRSKRSGSNAPLMPLAIFGISEANDMLRYAKTFASIRKYDKPATARAVGLFLFGDFAPQTHQLNWGSELLAALDAMGVVRIQREGTLPREVLWAAASAALTAVGYASTLYVGCDVMAVRSLPLDVLRFCAGESSRNSNCGNNSSYSSGSSTGVCMPSSTQEPRLCGVPRGPLFSRLLAKEQQTDTTVLSLAVGAADEEAATELYLGAALDPSVLLFDGGGGPAERATVAAADVLRSALRAHRFAAAFGATPSELVILGLLGAAAASGEFSSFRIRHLGYEWSHQFGREWLDTRLRRRGPGTGQERVGTVSLNYEFVWVPRPPVRVPWREGIQGTAVAGISAASDGDIFCTNDGTRGDGDFSPVFVRFAFTRPWDGERFLEQWERDDPRIVELFRQWRATPVTGFSEAARATAAGADAANGAGSSASGKDSTLGESDCRGCLLFHDDATLLRIKRCKAGLFMYVANDYIGATLDTYGEWESSFHELAAAVIRPGWTVFDVGAHMGTHTVAFAQLVGPAGCVVAVEPQNLMHGLLVSNVVLNDVQDFVQVRHCAVGAAAGMLDVPFMTYQGSAREVNFGGVSLRRELQRPGPTYSVQVETIDGIVNGLEQRCPHFIKLDVEFMELEALRGAAQCLEDCRPMLYVEFNLPRTEVAAELLAHITSMGYFCHYHNFLRVGSVIAHLESAEAAATGGMAALAGAATAAKASASRVLLSWNILCGTTDEHTSVIAPLGLPPARDVFSDNLFSGLGCTSLPRSEDRIALTGAAAPLCWTKDDAARQAGGKVAMEKRGGIPDYYSPDYRPTGHIERRALLTETVQEELYRHQHPMFCEGKRFAVLQPHIGGIGSIVHVTGAALAWSLNKDRILLYRDDFGSQLAHGDFCGSQRSFACFFMPLSNCSLTAMAAAVVDVVTVDNVMGEGLPERWRERYLNETGNIGSISMRYWWRGQAAAYVLRLNPRTSAHLKQQRLLRASSGVLPLPLPDNTVSIHVRHGDKALEMTLRSWDEHEKAADRLAAGGGDGDGGFNERFVFLSTENPAVVEEAAASERWRVMALKFPRGNENLWQQISKGDELFLFSLENLFEAIEAWHFVGTRGSNWNRLIDELRAIWPAHPVGCCSTYAEVGCQPSPGKAWCEISDGIPGDW